MVLRCTHCVAHIEGLVGIGPRQVQRHAQRDFRIGNIFHLVRHFFAALRIFFLELRHQSFGALRIQVLKGSARVVRHDAGDENYRGQYRSKKDEEKFCAKAHGCAPAAPGGDA